MRTNKNIIELKKRTLIFGCVPGFKKQLKEHLKNVVLNESDVIPNKEAVKHAEVIWVQTYGISHSAVYRIRTIARKINADILFFNTKNINTCIDMILTADADYCNVAA